MKPIKEISIFTVLNAVRRHPYPINAEILVKYDLSYQMANTDEEIPKLSRYIEDVDVREYAELAYKSYCKDLDESNEKYYSLLREFEEYKKKNAEFEQFKRFMRNK